MGNKSQLYMLESCPFCWKVRGLVEYLNIPYDAISINPRKAKKLLPSAPEWTKTPVWVDEDTSVIVDSTPIMIHIDEKYNQGNLWNSDDIQRRDEWKEWVDTRLSKATVPILYGSLLSAFTTTLRVSKMEKFGFFSRRIYAWAGFIVMWGFIARKRVKSDGRKPKKLWHDLLDEFTQAFDNKPFFGGEKPDMIDFLAYGYVSSISPFSQFKHIEEHQPGISWFQRMKNQSKS